MITEDTASLSKRPKLKKTPYKPDSLVAQPAGQSTDLKQLVSSVNRWREQYNPLRGFTLAKATMLIEQGERGMFADLQWAYRRVERASPTLRAVIKRRLAAIKKLSWSIKTVSELPDGATQAMADAQKATLSAAYGMIDNVRQAIGHLCLAEFRGYAHLQKHRNSDGDTYHLEPLDQWNFVRDGIYGVWGWNPGANNVMIWSGDITTLPPQMVQDDFIVREEPMPIDEIALRYYCYESLGVKDWAGFVEIYGIPSGIVIMPQNIPTGQETAYETAANNIASGSSGALPFGSDYKPNEPMRGINPFPDFLEFVKSEIVLAGTSGKLTMLNDSTGLGSGQSSSHEDTFDELAEAEAQEISELFQRTIDAEELAKEHPDEPVLAYFELAAKNEEDVNEICDQTLKLSQAGYKVDAEQLGEKTGFDIEEKPEPVPPTGIPGAGPGAEEDPAKADARKLMNRAAILNNDRLLAAFADDLQPLRSRLESILQIQDPDVLRKRLTAFVNQLPQLLQDINADPESAQALGDAMRTALQKGLAGQKPT